VNFSLTEDQQLLADSLARFVERDYGFEQRRAIIHGAGTSAQAWRTLAELGVLALPLPVDHGGFGGSAADLLPVMNALGRGLVVEPYLATVVLGATAIAAGGSDAQRARWLPAVADGSAKLAFAHLTGDADGGRLRGRAAVVLHAAEADALVVAAGEQAFLVPRDAPGLAVRAYRTIDGLRGADLAFDGVAADDALPGGAAGVALACDRARAALCAEAVGVMEQLNALTLEYLRTRQQFGQPIGRFQVLQHRAVDMFIDAEQSKSMAYAAALAADAGDAAARRAGVAAASEYIARAGRRLAKAAIQLHGGMGVTDEMPASHYAKRATMIGTWLETLAWQ
jgi:alkylation response protein AidB-like acyl-CoA dehydrogenase